MRQFEQRATNLFASYPWYNNAGSAMALGAIHFFAELGINNESLIYVVESFHPNPRTLTRRTHLEAANDLLVAFTEGQALINPQSADPDGHVSVLPILDGYLNSPPPVLLRPDLVLKTPT
jgi:hypothetical protein